MFARRERYVEASRATGVTRPLHSRTRIYLWIAAAIVVMSAAPFAMRGSPVAHAAGTLNAIQLENQNPGDPTWDNFSSVAQQDAIDGYASPLSVSHGQSVDFYITTTASSYTIKIYRTGWYGGAGARLMANLGSFPGVHQAIPAPDPVTGIVSCDGKWQKSYTLNVPSTWTTGVYLARLDASNGDSSYIFFVVRNDGGHEGIEFQTSATTYQAYNAWGGVSLYTNNTNGSVYPYAHATKVSFDRPFDPLDSNGAGHYLYYEYPFVRWAESQGYDLTYVTDVDTHANSNPLTNHQAFLSVGHDEYWSLGMRTNVQNAINAGVNVGFFGANDLYWQIRFEPNAHGVANRVEVGYKDFAEAGAPGPDPQWGVNNAIVTDNWRSSVVNQPENAVIGVMYDGQVPNNNYAYVVQNASSWVYAGTGFSNGSSVPGIVGYEYDKIWNNGASPAGLTTLSSSAVCCSDTQWDNSNNTTANSTIYTAASGARVFAAGSIAWSWGLDNYSSTGNTANAGIQKTTANILANFTSGAAPPAPVVTLSPTSLTFASQTVNTTSSAQVVTLTNTGNATLNVNGISIGGTNAADFAQTNTCGSSVAASGSCTFSVTFTPTATGTRSASISIADNANGSPQTVGLSGTGAAAPAPAVTLSPTSLSFGNQNVGTTSATQTVTLTNSGNAALSISGIALTGTNAADFAQTNTCPTGSNTLAAGTNCTISVTFTPSVTGAEAATVSITDNAAGSPHGVSLTGTGVQPAPGVTLSPASIAFGNQNVGTPSAAHTVTLTNNGTAALTISSITIGGTNAADFAQTNTCPSGGSTLATGASCTISVTFTPSVTGAESATISVADNAAGSPHTVALSGTGVQPAPAVTLSPTSLSYGNQPVGAASAAKTVTLTNSGTAPLSITSIAIAGTNASDFAQTNACPSTLGVGGNCTISVTFTPSATGARSASVQISDNATGSPHSVALSGTGTAPAVTLTPTSLTFSNQTVNTTSAAQVVTLKNSGTAPLSITSVSLTGANAASFAQTNTCPSGSSTLAAGASCTISVTFTPTAVASYAASVSITDNAVGSPHTVALSGTGVTTSSVIFSDGFESGTLPGSWTSTTVSSGNTLKIDSTLAHSGSDSLLAVTNKNNTGNAYITKTFTGQTTLDVRAYYYLSNPVQWGEVNILSLYAQGNFIGWVYYYADPSSPAFQVYNGASNAIYNCTLPTLNAWHSVELQYVLSTTTTGSFTLWLDGTKACGATGIATSPSSGLTIDEVHLGIDGADNSVGLSVHVDDAVISKSYIGA